MSEVRNKEATEAKVDAYIVAVLSGKGPGEAAEAIGVSNTTAWRWRQDPEVQRRLREARQYILTRALDELAGAACQAVGVLKAALASEKEGVRVVAAGKLLDYFLRYQSAEETAAMMDRARSAYSQRPKSVDPSTLPPVVVNRKGGESC